VIYTHIYIYIYIYIYILGCNNGGGGGKFINSKAVSCKVDRNTETVIIWFFACTGEILET